ncbi:glycosyltransferase family 4 protein [Bacteroides thetaiotaomicron]|uniref:glycosyltransferase family 4 protein n=1 Tax=Bacteroides thetaiotaomicron TaxID=818 RepID=UPI001F48E614|nr:glycosyltransferase family 4 protein [Bacteroides thetaiotaomicron]MCE9077071.1 glycosyltransferase family 4 protein [Bacteroides thetaiotaomicron]MCS2602514.1 glycosyltransferase family 4 protein [Bacteroides thetaiotaomicron]
MRSVLLLDVKASSLCAGINRYCENLVELFTANSKVEVIQIDYSRIRLKSFKLLGKKIYSFTDLFKYNDLRKCDIIHINGFASIVVLQFFIISILLRKKIVYTPHFHPFEKLNHPLLAKIYFFLLLRPCLYYVKTITTINKEDTAFFKRFHKNVVCIPNWLQQFPDLRIKEPKNKKLILFVGRADANKGIDHLYTIPRNKYEVHCVTSGYIQRDDFIIHKDASETELKSLYKKASLVVIPSRYEAFSYVALEALSFGTPIVISDRVRIYDYLSHLQGVTTFLYGDYVAFNIAIDITIQQSVPVEKVMSIFDKKKIRNSLLNVYVSI